MLSYLLLYYEVDATAELFSATWNVLITMPFNSVEIRHGWVLLVCAGVRELKTPYLISTTTLFV